MTITLDTKDGQHYRPPLFRQIEQYDGSLYNVDRKRGHPLALALKSWAGVESALDRGLDDFTQLAEAFDTSRCDIEHNKKIVSHALQSYGSFLARVADFIETIGEKVASCFVKEGNKTSIRNLRNDRLHIDLINNAIKHNQNFLSSLLVITPEGKKIQGFAVYELTARGMQRPNPIIHKAHRAFSFATEIRRTLATAYIVGDNVGQFITALSKNAPTRPLQQRVDPNEYHLLGLIQRVIDLPIDVFPDENSTTMPFWHFENGVLTIRRAGGKAIPAPRQSTFVMPATPVIGALSIQVP